MIPRAAIALAGALVLAGCMVGPDYTRPDAPVSASWGQGDAAAGLWKPATPQDLPADDRWWTRYGDATLDALMAQVDPANQNIAAAEAAYRQSIALLSQARANLFPTFSGDALVTRSKSSVGTTGRVGTIVAPSATTTYDTAISASWEIDLWGRVRRSIESNAASAQASAAELAGVRLSSRATLAQAYFQLRVAERRMTLLADTVAAYKQALAIAENRYAAGVTARLDVIQAQSQLASAEARLIDARIPRAQLQNAIAVLVGEPPAAVKIAEGALPPLARDVPLVLPSALLERRPDIAAAERRVAAANAQIGVATAAYFPSLSLSGLLGYRTTDLSSWISAPSQYWSFGPQLALTLIDFGRRSATVRQAEAFHDETVAAYRQTVLTALQDVEDNLVTLRVLDEEGETQQRAIELARRTLELTLNQYRAGLVAFSNVVIAQTSLLAAELNGLDVASRQYDAQVGLVRGIGGGWSSAELAPLPAPSSTRSSAGVPAQGAQ